MGGKLEMAAIKYIDLFCGIGGFRHALDSVTTRCVFSSDIDPDARLSYAQNWGEEPVGDIAQIEAQVIPEHDVLCGGFPCQPFSISGNQGGFEDARGTLLHEILRIARYHQPRVLFLENVKNFLGHAEGETLSTTLRLLNRAGYHVHYSLLNASCYGVAQKRERVYFVAFRKDLGITTFRFPEPTNEDCAVEDILLPKNDSRLDALVIERQDLHLKSERPTERENRPIRIGTVGKGGPGRTGLQSQRTCDYALCVWGRNRCEDGDVFNRSENSPTPPRGVCPPDGIPGGIQTAYPPECVL
jgi:DNA (cytosine-5)-methyltransferase 1